MISGSSSEAGSTGASPPADDEAPVLAGGDTAGDSAGVIASARDRAGTRRRSLDWRFAMRDLDGCRRSEPRRPESIRPRRGS